MFSTSWFPNPAPCWVPSLVKWCNMHTAGRSFASLQTWHRKRLALCLSRKRVGTNWVMWRLAAKTRSTYPCPTAHASHGRATPLYPRASTTAMNRDRTRSCTVAWLRPRTWQRGSPLSAVIAAHARRFTACSSAHTTWSESTKRNIAN